MKKWITEKSGIVWSSRIMEIVAHIRRSQSEKGRKAEFYSIKSHDWAVVIPLYEKNGEKYIKLVRQYRHGSDRISVEFPSGNIENGENPANAALRELKEETGAEFEKVTLLGTASPNPAIMENTVHFFLAEGLESEGHQSLDEHEEIEVLEMTEKEAFGSYLGIADETKNAITMAAVAFYRMRK